MLLPSSVLIPESELNVLDVHMVNFLLEASEKHLFSFPSTFTLGIWPSEVPSRQINMFEPQLLAH